MACKAQETDLRKMLLLCPNVQEAIDLKLFLPMSADLIVSLGVAIV